MGETRKTTLLWLAAIGVLLITCWIAVITAPPLFTSVVQEGEALTSSRELVTEYLAHIGKLDLNEADAESLCALPHMTDTLARRILLERDNRDGQRFSSTDDLLCVDGVTSELLEIWAELLYCG